MIKSPTPAKGWTIGKRDNRSNWLIGQLFQSTRKDAIEKLLGEYTIRPTWRQLRKRGFYVIKVRMEAAE